MLRLPLFVLFLSVPAVALARTKAPAKENKPAAEAETGEQPEEREKPRFHPVRGPKKIDLGHDLDLDLPAGMLFLDRKEGKTLMESNGNIIGKNFLGLVAQEGSQWLVTFTYWEDGYVKDDDAAHFDASEILDGIREGNEEANELRKERGFKPLAIDGWTESPRYERGPHHLVWGLKVSDADGASINFYTRVLGRRGYVAINLIDDPARIEASKKEALAVLKATTFRPGARYEDFDSKKDKIAEYGLAALVAGGAGAAALKFAKIGLLAKFGGKLLALLIAGKKLLVVFVLAIGANLKRLFARLFRKKGGAVGAAPSGEVSAPTDLPPPGEQPPAGLPPQP